MKTEKSITERIKTYADACHELGIPLYPERILSMTEDELAYYKLKVISRALNEGWEADWANKDERKYYPYFEVLPYGANPGLVCVFSDLAFSFMCSRISLYRLAYKSRTLAEYAGEQFNELYAKFIL